VLLSRATRLDRRRVNDGLPGWFREPGDGLSRDGPRQVELLHREGVDIARRTVVKYRKAMRIPSSFERRRDKRPQAWKG
jgi:hypothetical protein